MVSKAVTQVAGQVAHEGKFQWFTRLGFAARGLLYILIAWLAYAAGRTEDLTGALEYVGHGSGKVLLIAVAAGLATYGLWRLSDAALGTEHPGHGWKALGPRVASAGVGSVYLYLAYKAARILLGSRPGGMSTEQEAEKVLHVPGGDWVLTLVAIGFAAAAASQLWKAYRCRFLCKLAEGASQLAWVKWMGRLGYAARGVVFLICAWLMYRASADHVASEAGNLEKALDTLRGPFLLPVVAGLAFFGLFSIVEARFRLIRAPSIGQVRRHVKHAMR